MRKIIFMLLLVFLLTACTKTHEKNFTAEEVCKDKKKFADPDDLRDEYDQCLIFTRENLRDDAKCQEKCKDYCLERNMNLRNSYTDFAGCHCTCSEKVKIKK